jgi:uncharacterized protein (TIGR02147 family)
MDAPDPFAYLDYRVFLDAWFEKKKASNPRFSHRSFASRVGERSPSFLADIIKGRRNLTAVRRDAVATIVGLTPDERDWFELLVALDQAADLDERGRIWEKMAGTKRFREARQLEGDSFAYLTYWYYPAIRELVQRPDFVEEPAWIAQTLRPEITEEEAEQALRALWSLGMLTRGADGKPVQAEGSIATPRQVAGLAAHNYHAGMLGRAIEGIRGFKSAERHYIGVTVCVPESQIPALKKELNGFASHFLDLCESNEAPPERVYQCHLALLPLSKPTSNLDS